MNNIYTHEYVLYMFDDLYDDLYDDMYSLNYVNNTY